MCDKAVNIYPSTIKFVPEYLLTQEMCDKAVNILIFLHLTLFPIDIKLEKCARESFMKTFLNCVLS